MKTKKDENRFMSYDVEAGVKCFKYPSEIKLNDKIYNSATDIIIKVDRPDALTVLNPNERYIVLK